MKLQLVFFVAFLSIGLVGVTCNAVNEVDANASHVTMFLMTNVAIVMMMLIVTVLLVVLSRRK